MKNLEKCRGCENQAIENGEPLCVLSDMYIRDIIACVEWTENEKQKRLFICSHCGYEDTFDVTIDEPQLECPHCRNGVLKRTEIEEKE